jgi:putative salt-induced outer membrane protein YdiY
MTKGNTDTRSIYADAEVVARSTQNRFTLGGNYSRAEDKGERTVDNMTGYMKYDYFVSRQWYFFAALSGTKDKFKDLNLRTAAGLGVGYQFWESDIGNLSLEIGPSYINEDLIEAEDDDYAAGRWALNFDHWLFSKRVQFFHYHEGLVGLEDASDLFLRSQTGFRLPILANFNATAQFNYDWDNTPPPGTRKADEYYIVSLGYTW